MALKAKDADGNNVYLDKAGAGTVGDPYTDGTPITGQSLESGGQGPIGWFASIRKAINDRWGVLGQATMANSAPVVIASNQSAVPVTSSAPTPASATATIANAASLSGAVDLGSAKEVLRLIMPSAWTAASLTMQVSDDGTNYNDFYDAFGVEYTVTVSASRNIVLPMGDLRGVRYLKVRSGTSASPVAQGASRDILIVAR